MLHDRDAERRVERVRLERQRARVGGGEPDADVVCARRRDGVRDARRDQIDAEQPHLRDPELSEPDLRRSRAATDVQDAVARPRLQCLPEKIRELAAPPPLAEMFECGRGQHVDLARDAGLDVGHWAPVYPMRNQKDPG